MLAPNPLMPVDPVFFLYADVRFMLLPAITAPQRFSGFCMS